MTYFHVVTIKCEGIGCGHKTKKPQGLTEDKFITH